MKKQGQKAEISRFHALVAKPCLQEEGGRKREFPLPVKGLTPRSSVCLTVVGRSILRLGACAAALLLSGSWEPFPFAGLQNQSGHCPVRFPLDADLGCGVYSAVSPPRFGCRSKKSPCKQGEARQAGTLVRRSINRLYVPV